MFIENIYTNHTTTPERVECFRILRCFCVYTNSRRRDRIVDNITTQNIKPVTVFGDFPADSAD